MTRGIKRVFLAFLKRISPLIKNDTQYLKWLWWIKFGTKLNIDNPQTYNEKLQWIKIHNRDPKYTMLVDKYAVKDYVASIIGKEHIVPTLEVWDSVNEINFDSLPNKFVLKPTFDSGGRIICRDKSMLDYDKTRKVLYKLYKRNYYYENREWPYKNVPKRIIAEKYLYEPGSDCLTDYKWFCFNGEPKLLYISKDAAETPYTDFFDMNFNHLPIRMKDPNSKITPSKPKLFDEMKAMAEKLSIGIPEVRVDFYVVDDVVYFGEYTFFHNSGLTPIFPGEWDQLLGKWILLPKKDLCRS